MQPLKPYQIWRTRVSANAPWRQVEIMSVSDGEIKLRYLDMTDGSEAERTVTTTADYVEQSQHSYMFVSDRPQTMR